MRQWITARYEDGQLTLNLGASATYGKEKRTATATLPISDDDKTVAQIQKACEKLLSDHADELEAEAQLAASRALVYAADRKEVA